MVNQHKMSLVETTGVLLMAVCVCIMAPLLCFASDFPGQGNVGDWSQALPYYNRGNRYLNQGRYQDAMQDFKTAVGLYPYDPDFIINLGVSLRQLDNYAEAEQCFRQAAKLNPQDWVVWSNLANACLKQNRLNETLANFKQALKCGPPQQERIAIEKDMADITKILKMQSPSAPLPLPKTATNKNQKAAAQSLPARKQSAPVIEKCRPVNMDAFLRTGKIEEQNAMDSKNLQDSGWDYLQK